MHRSDGKTWEQVIVEAENYEKIKFKGSIRFLFTDDKGNDDWQDFDEKFKNIHHLLGNQDTIKDLIPYLSDEDIRDIFSKRNLSDEENNLRMLFQKFPQKVLILQLFNQSANYDYFKYVAYGAFCGRFCFFYTVVWK